MLSNASAGRNDKWLRDGEAWLSAAARCKGKAGWRKAKAMRGLERQRQSSEMLGRCDDVRGSAEAWQCQATEWHSSVKCDTKDTIKPRR